MKIRMMGDSPSKKRLSSIDIDKPGMNADWIVERSGA